MENTAIPHKINSVSSYIKAIFDMRNAKISEYSLSSYWFFRGQKNSSWGMCPNVFRKDALAYEFDSIESAIRQRPYDFRECTTDFEILTKLQHYGLGTRLLDVTLNPLVALYFATESCEEYIQGKDGRGKYIPRDGKIAYQYSYGHRLTELEVRIACALPFIDFTEDLTVGGLLEKLCRKGIVKVDEENSLKENDYKRFIQVIQSNSFVVSAHSNERLTRQSGAFIIPTAIKIIKDSGNNGDLLVRKARCNLDEAFEKDSFIIPYDKKEIIREELDFLNINEATLFPELEHQLIYLQHRKLPEPGSVELYEKFEEHAPIDSSENTGYANKEPHPDVDNIVNSHLSNYPDMIADVIASIKENISVIDWWQKSSVISRIIRDITRILQSQLSVHNSTAMANSIMKDLMFTNS